MREKYQSPPASHGCGAFFSLLLCLLCLINARPAAAQVNVTQSFTGSTAPGWTLSGTSSLTSGGADPSGSGWLRLTSNGGNQAGAAIYNTADALASGIQVTFDFASWGGSGADGICFFLLDGSVATPTVGAYGGSLGYAQETNISDGLSSGYLGVALDEYGNFSNPTQGRIGGPGLTAESVSIRGSGTGQTGYPYLAGTANLSSTYGKLDTPSVSVRPPQAGTGYRHCVITITPAQKVYVQITYGYGTTPVTVVNGYDLTTASGQAARPATLKFGFTASTGGANNYHEIRNFSITPNIVADMAITKTHSGSFVRTGTGTYTLTASNVGTAVTTAPVTVVDTLPTGLTPTAASGTGWTCGISGQTVTCTRSDPLAAGTAYPAITVTASVATRAASTLTNTATVSSGGELNTANNSASDPTTIINGPQILLVKRITALNGVNITGFVVDPINTDDLNANWPAPASTYLRGALTATNVQSGDLVEYTIYFLSSGGRNATNFLLCDLIPTNMTFVPYSYNGLTPTDGGLSGVDSGIALALSTTVLPTTPTAYLTNTADSDRGQFYTPGTQAPAAANSGSGFTVPLPAASNFTGVVAVSVVTSPTTLPFATAPGVPINSYGFIRFQAKVN